MPFGRYLRETREDRDITLTELARRIKVSIPYLSRIERERENPPPDRLLLAIADVLDVPRDQLFAQAQRLPPDLRARTSNVIASYRAQQARGAR